MFFSCLNCEALHLTFIGQSRVTWGVGGLWLVGGRAGVESVLLQYFTQLRTVTKSEDCRSESAAHPQQEIMCHLHQDSLWEMCVLSTDLQSNKNSVKLSRSNQTDFVILFMGRKTCFIIPVTVLARNDLYLPTTHILTPTRSSDCPSRTAFWSLTLLFM